MISIKHSDIPTYLHDSDFYKSLEENTNEGGEQQEGDDEIAVPESCMKMDMKTDSFDDFRYLL